MTMVNEVILNASMHGKILTPSIHLFHGKQNPSQLSLRYAQLVSITCVLHTSARNGLMGCGLGSKLP